MYQHSSYTDKQSGKGLWERIDTMYEGVTLDQYVVMPDHLHGIIIYHHQDEKNIPRTPLERIIRNFKSFTTHEYYKDKTRLTGNLWERGYFEHVIRYNEFDIIRDYVRNNPANWENDRFFDLEQEYLQSIQITKLKD